MLKIEMLPAYHGDCIWIEYGHPGDRIYRVLIDGGPRDNYKRLRARLAALAPNDRRFDLLIVSHIDEDHIGGVLELLRDESFGQGKLAGLTFDDIWFNDLRHLSESDVLGVEHGELLSRRLTELALSWNKAFGGKAVAVPEQGALPRLRLAGGLQLTLLSPTFEELHRLRSVWESELEKLIARKKLPPDVLGEEGRIDIAKLAREPFDPDDSEANGSSIAVLAEFDDQCCLLSADAFSNVLAQNVQRLCAERGLGVLAINAFKLPHHGGRHNLNVDLLDQLECRNFLVSTSGARYGHPDPEAISRVLANANRQPYALAPIKLWFNYRRKTTEIWDNPEFEDEYNYSAEYPDAVVGGSTLTL